MRSLICLIALLIAVEVRASTLAQFRTVFGNIEVELFDQDKPGTVNNFIRYVQAGLYQDSFIHRCDPIFVIQGGGFYVADRHTTNQTVYAVPTFAAISNEFGVGKTYSNVYGTIAMAQLGGDTNSANSQWFFNLTNNSFLNTNGFFTVFGKVVRGSNVLSLFRTFKASSSTNTIVNLGGPFTELPSLKSPTNVDDLINNLVYVDVSLLNVQVQQLTNHTRQISWNSVVGKTNYVEFTTNLPPTWRSLVATNGTGNTLSVIDTNIDVPRRFYRVRVNY